MDKFSRRKVVAQIVANAWNDEKFMQRLLDHPVDVFNEAGLEVPAGLDIKMLLDTAKLEYGVIPARPDGPGPFSPDDVHFMYCFTAFHHRKMVEEGELPP